MQYVSLSCLSDRPSVCLSVCPSVRPSVRPSVCPSDRPSVCPSVRPSACLSACLSPEAPWSCLPLYLTLPSLSRRRRREAARTRSWGLPTSTWPSLPAASASAGDTFCRVTTSGIGRTTACSRWCCPPRCSAETPASEREYTVVGSALQSVVGGKGEAGRGGLTCCWQRQPVT